MNTTDARYPAATRAVAKARAARRWGSTPIEVATPGELAAYAHQCRTTSCITSHVPVGPTRTALEPWVAECARQAMPLVQISRDWDRLFWPHATAGFFKLKERIPRILSELGISKP